MSGWQTRDPAQVGLDPADYTDGQVPVKDDATGLFLPGAGSPTVGDLRDLGDVWKQDTEPTTPDDGDVWLRTSEPRAWLYRTGGEWVIVAVEPSDPVETPDFRHIGPTITSITESASGSIDLELDTPFGIDGDGDPYYDPAGAADDEQAWFGFDRDDGLYKLLSWLAADEEESDTVDDPELDDPDFYTMTQLTIPTYDGSGQVVHPDVVKIDGGWNGWLYWMAMTPFPDGDDQFENPSIVVSNDGSTWQEPAGITNPIVPSPSGSDFNSDCEMVFDGTTVWVYFRETDLGAGNIVQKITSSIDGINWTTPAVLFTTAIGGHNLSPTVVNDNGTWRMWTVSSSPSPNVMAMRTAPAPDGPWSAPAVCTAADPEGRDLWHLDVVKDGPVFRAFVQTCTLGASGTAGRILIGTSADGLAWAFKDNAVLVPTGSGWNGDSIYRGSGLFEQDRWRFWLSARSSGGQWSPGYSEIDPFDFPEAP